MVYSITQISKRKLTQIVKMFIDSKKSIHEAPFQVKKTESSKIKDIDWDNVFEPQSPSMKINPIPTGNLPKMNTLNMPQQSKVSNSLPIQQKKQ